MTVTQFLGAFNDNLFKQLVLLLALTISTVDRQPIAMFVFSFPFILFSGYAGFLADRFSKRRIIVLSKVAEIVVMGLGVPAFLLFGWSGFPGLLLVLFLMGTQSAFFGPSKYGIMPEMLRTRDLPRANGVILMTTFLAIIFGTASAGVLSDALVATAPPVASSAQPDLTDASTSSADDTGARSSPVAATRQLWIASLVCVGIAVVGTCTALLVRHVPAAVPRLRFTSSALTIPPETRHMLGQDRPLLGALIASSVFWMVAGIAQQAVNSLGKRQLALNDFETSLLPACIGVGIAIGSVLAGRISAGTANFHVMRLGGWGLVASLLVVALPGPFHGHLLGFRGSLAAMIVTGMFCGMYAIPLQVFMQSRPPEGHKGRMIAAMNQANFAAIFVSSGVYWLFDRIVELCSMNRSPIFAMTALVMLPVLILYRPRDPEQLTTDN